MEKKKMRGMPYFYPLPVIIVGANVDEKANFVTIAFCGMCQYKPPILYISCAKNHYTCKGIKKNKAFSVNFPNTDMVKITDYIGVKSGKEIDKSALFDVFYGELKTAPMIREAPLNHECKVIDIIDLGSTNDIIFGEIVQTFVNESCLVSGKLEIKKLNPFVFSGSDNSYFEIGNILGKAYNIGKDYIKK